MRGGGCVWGGEGEGVYGGRGEGEGVYIGCWRERERGGEEGLVYI